MYGRHTLEAGHIVGICRWKLLSLSSDVRAERLEIGCTWLVTKSPQKGPTESMSHQLETMGSHFCWHLQENHHSSEMDFVHLPYDMGFPR